MQVSGEHLQIRRYYIGLMSGTSIDGVDAVLADFGDPDHASIVASASLPMPASLRAEFLALNQPGPNELERAARAGNQLADLYFAAVHQVLVRGDVTATQVLAIGAHGQTVRHAPDDGYTIQINAPARLAELTGIAVIADFRSRDVAAGGQGAPLVPAFHNALFSRNVGTRAIVNLGGIANVTLLRPQHAVCGFDTGPANVLLDIWIQKKKGVSYDRDGAWAATGRMNPELLEFLLGSEPWLKQAPPKSTGRHLFNHVWLTERLARFSQTSESPPDVDVQATLQAFTVRTVADAILSHAPETTEVLVCGGGAMNISLMTMLASSLPCEVSTTARYGVPVQLMEALAFAWLAQAWDLHMPTSLPAVTGAKAPRILGCKYPA